MHKPLYIIGLATALLSCASKKPVQKVVVKPKPVQKTIQTPPKPLKPPVENSKGVEFYRSNISDPTRNDNTISYGSIVTAEPANFKVVKTYFPAVAQNFRQRFIILHYTALNDDKSVSVLTQQAVSSHYLVNALDDKEIYQLVDENKRAYHAGVSSWRGSQSLNDTSIGIEIVNEAKDAPGGGYIFPAFPEYQIEKVAALVKDLATRYQIPPSNILAHSDIAPMRKQDPGPMFPWKQLYEKYQIGMWYDDADKEIFLAQNPTEQFDAQQTSYRFIYSYQTMLKDFGYGLEPNGTWDDATKKTITAFQYHFRPEKYDGVMDQETFAILQALLKKYPK